MLIAKLARMTFWMAAVLALIGCANGAAPLGTPTKTTTHAGDPTPTPTPAPGTSGWISKTSHLWATLDATLPVGTTSPGTQLKFDDVIEDPLAEFDKKNFVFTPRAAGIYQVTVLMTLAGPWMAGDYCKLILSKGSTGTSYGSVAIASSAMPGGTNPCSVSISTSVPIAAGEFLLVNGIIAASSSHSTNASLRNPFNYIMVTRISD